VRLSEKAAKTQHGLPWNCIKLYTITNNLKDTFLRLKNINHQIMHKAYGMLLLSEEESTYNTYWCMVHTTFIPFRVVSQSFLRKFRSRYQSEFSRQCNLVLLILNPNTFPLLDAYPAAHYVFFPVLQFPTLFPSIVSFSPRCDQTS